MASPLEQFLSRYSGPSNIRPLLAYDANKALSGRTPLTSLQYQTAARSIQKGKPIIVDHSDHGILSDILHLPGNFIKDATETVQGVFSPWKWIPSIWHNVETGNIPALLPLIPGYTTLTHGLEGNFHDILTHPAGSVLDVLPYAKPGLKAIAAATDYGKVADTAGEAGRLVGPTQLDEANLPHEPTIMQAPNDHLSEDAKFAREHYTITPDQTLRHKFFGRFINHAVENKPYQFSVQQSLNEMGYGPDDLVEVYHGAGNNPSSGPFRNGSIDRWVAQKFTPEGVEPTVTRVPRENIVGFGDPHDMEVIYKPGPGRRIVTPPAIKPPEVSTPIGDIAKEINDRISNPPARPQRIRAALEAGKPGSLLYNLLPESVSNPEEGILGRRLSAIRQRSATARVTAIANREFQDIYLNEYHHPMQELFADVGVPERHAFSQWMSNFSPDHPSWWEDAAGVRHEVPQVLQDKLPGFQVIQKKLESAATDYLTKVYHKGVGYLYSNDSPVVGAIEKIAKNQNEVLRLRSEADPARQAWIDNLGEEVAPKPRVSVRTETDPITGEKVKVKTEVPPDTQQILGRPIRKSRFQLFKVKDQIEKTIADIERQHDIRAIGVDRIKHAQAGERLANLEAKLADLQARHDLLSQREMLHTRISKTSAAHVSPEEYHLLDIPKEAAGPGEVQVATNYLKALRKLDAAKEALANSHVEYTKTFAKTAPATFIPKINDLITARVVEKIRANHPDFLEGDHVFNWDTTQNALEQHTTGRNVVEAGLITQNELNKIGREVQSSWQELADEGLAPMYLSNVTADRFPQVLDPNLLKSGAVRDTPYAVESRTVNLTPSGIKDPVVGLSAPALAILRRNQIREFYGQFLVPMLKTQPELDSWLDRELSNTEMKPLSQHESLTSRRAAIRRSRWVEFNPDNVDPAFKELLPEGEKVYLPKEVHDTVVNLFSPKARQLETLSKANIHGMRVFRTAVMGLSAKHLAHIGFGGMTMLLMRGGVEELSPELMRAAWHMAKEELLPKELSAGVDFYSSDQLKAGILPKAEQTTVASKIGSKLAGGLAGIQNFEEKISNFERSLSYLAEHERILKGRFSPDLSQLENDEVRAALQAGDKEKALELAKRGAIKHANKALIDFDGMLPAERGIIRNIFPFYAYTRHIFKYALSYPIDYPLRASYVYKLGQIVQNDFADRNLPEQWMRYLTFGPTKTGDVTNIDLRFLNPFRSLPEEANLSGTVQSLNPFLGYAMEWAGINPFTTSADQFPELRYNPKTGYTETKRKPFDLLGLVSQIVPEAGALGLISDSSGAWNKVPSYAFLPGWPHHDNLFLQQGTDTLNQLKIAQNVVNDALRSGNTDRLRDFNLVPLRGQLVNAGKLADIISRLKGKGTPRQQLGL